MATVAHSGQMIAKGVHKAVWSGLAGSDVGDALVVPNFPDKTVQFTGTFTTGTVVMQGSNDGGTTWTTLTDPQGNNISKTAAGVEAIEENPIMIRPSISGGTTDAVTVTLVSQSSLR